MINKIAHAQKQIKGSQHYMRKDFYNGEGERAWSPSEIGKGLGEESRHPRVSPSAYGWSTYSWNQAVTTNQGVFWISNPS